MTEFEKWIHDDITWCGNECEHTECMRNLANKLTTGYFSMSYFRNTDMCPLSDKQENSNDKST